MKASFLIKSKEEKVVTEKGLRAFVLEKLLNSGISKGTVENLDRKTVQVRLEGDESRVKQLVEELKKAVIAEFGNPKISFTQLEENPSLELPDLMRSSQALMLGQLHKGVSVQLDILKAQKGLMEEQKELVKGQKELVSSQKELVEGQKEMTKGQNGLFEEQKEIAKGQKELTNSQKELANSQKELVEGQKGILIGQKDTLRELTHELRNLPKEIAAAIKGNA